ncbi:HNH endonuclease [Streptomyces sp. VNUA24]|uniref:restriction system modified-DNA reader domain-containing protein n=1 Tax=Streptomyces sp. VNUA24 TaxID=3031131 RepID=UPI0023B7CC40|nr:HNH endonuclease [Streptomyces sp. VNUA24]WEH18106.1 HNH endonuclease [Streptomyces sp. VNUA24]
MNSLVVPATWNTKIANTVKAVREAISSGEKPEFPSHWTDPQLRQALVDLVGPKCWYCETPVHGNNPDVDHFRPKSAIIGVKGPGYWWLAYAPSNYRLACGFCNSGGAQTNGQRGRRTKSNHFPLLDESTRATKELSDCAKEQRVLLDPADGRDARLIGFDIKGYARRRSGVPRSAAEVSRSICRADETIRILDLNRELLVDDRKTTMDNISGLAPLLTIAAAAPVAREMIERKIGIRSDWSTAALEALHMHPQAAERLIPPVSSPQNPAPLAPASGREIDLTDLDFLVSAQVLKPGFILTAEHDGDLRTAEVLVDGRISCDARVWSTPTSAARAVTGREDIDGWTFWTLNVNGATTTLAELRDSYRRQLLSG